MNDDMAYDWSELWEKMKNQYPSTITSSRLSLTLSRLGIKYEQKNDEEADVFFAPYMREIGEISFSVIVAFTVKKSTFQVRGLSPFLQDNYASKYTKEQIIGYCNEWNTTKIFPKALLSEGNLFAEISVFNVSEVSDSYIEKFVQNSIRLILEFFEDAVKIAIAS